MTAYRLKEVSKFTCALAAVTSAGNDLRQSIGEACSPGLELDTEECFVHVRGDQGVRLTAQTRSIGPLVVHADVSVVIHASDQEGRRLCTLAVQPAFPEGRKSPAVCASEVANGNFPPVDKNASNLTCSTGGQVE